MQSPSSNELRDNSRQNRKIVAKNAHKGIVLISSFVIFLISSYTIVAEITGHIAVVGSVLVNSGSILVQPITYLTIATLLLTYSGFELAKPHLHHFSATKISIIKLVTFEGLVLAAYEVFYNFSIWTAEISTNSLLGSLNPDLLINPFPNPNTPWNLVFATQLSLTVVIVGLYTLYVMRPSELKAHANR